MNDNTPFDSSEQWRDVVGYEGLYQVSNIGQVKRLAGSPRCITERILKQQIAPVGYYQVCLSSNSQVRRIEVHSLIAAAFIGIRPDGWQVNHMDGNKLNNHLSNLEYVTRSGNGLHAYRVLKRAPVCNGGARGEANHTAKLTADEVRMIRQLYASGVTNGELSRRYDVSPSRITRIVTRKQWKHIE